ncbi:MAG TPA: DUF1592 domain-containing protein [Polyangiaceae bacterium]|nr:DUF1592 domain-containing protein [Polyangiaceae bacterium]
MGFRITSLGGLGLLLGCATAAPPAEPLARVPPAIASAPAPAASLASCAEDLGAPNRRLTRFELAYAVEDVFGVDATALRALPGPAASIGNAPDILVGRMLDTSPRFLEPYRKAVLKLAADLSVRLAPRCAPDKAQAFASGPEGVRSCVLEALHWPAARLFRASPSSAELVAFRTELTAYQPADPAALFQHGIVRLLESPRFYMLENEAPTLDTNSQTEERFAVRRLVSRLSLSLWSSVPDQTLLQRAERGALADPAQFERELGRLLEDPRFQRFAAEFGRQWLRLDRRAEFRPSLESRSLVEDPARLAQAHAEAARLLARQLSSPRPLSDLLTASEAGPGSAGLLTSKAVLSALSTPIRGGGDENWLGRGLLVQGAFLCRSFPLAAVYPSELWADHALLDPHLTAASPRPGEPALLAIRTADKPCRECHRQLETLGAALSAFDGYGEPSAAAGVPGIVTGKTVANARELAAFILRTGRFQPCLAQKLLSYVLGRAVLPEKRAQDRCLVERLTQSAGAPTLRTWLWQALNSPEFRQQGAVVVRDKPVPSPNSSGYTDALAPVTLEAGSCRTFDAGAFLTQNCGTALCHGPGSALATFAVPDGAVAASLLRAGRPAADGYCAHFSGFFDAEQPLQSLVVRKVLGGASSCGAAMPITGGPRTLSEREHACFIQWLTEQARVR